MHSGTESMRSLIQANAAEIARLHRRLRETFALRARGPQEQREWRQAAEVFRSRYDALAFPGGYAGAAERLLAGDPYTMEAALCFLELRPYFLRSGYMFERLLPKAKRAPLLPEQAARLGIVLARLSAWKARKRRAAQGAGA